MTEMPRGGPGWAAAGASAREAVAMAANCRVGICLATLSKPGGGPRVRFEGAIVALTGKSGIPQSGDAGANPHGDPSTRASPAARGGVSAGKSGVGQSVGAGENPGRHPRRRGLGAAAAEA
jgi:hypothetical protein